ncbi:MAG: tetratricopeptide repeat protein, partial [Anaerolineae bacterium]|nr:tetratricopeptide repeat protein [Anaerolineae bacterium]
MSKRSSRRKRQAQQQKQEAKLTGAVLAEQGYQAFQQADYATAIKLWERAAQKKDAPKTVAAAIAEAYFRRAMGRPAAALADLEQAVNRRPHDQLYRYHLALANHRAGALEKAEALYRQLLAESPPFGRAAEPLAQLLIEQKKAVLKDPVWGQLSPAQQLALAAAEALIKDKAESTLRRLAESDLPPVWQGLAALALGDKAEAMQQLKPLAEPNSPLPPPARNVARYYLGLIAAEAGQNEAALAHWQAAQAGGLDSPGLRQNLSKLAYEQAIQAQQKGQPHQAAEWLEQARHTGPLHAALRNLSHQLKLEVGYAAAQKGDWGQALSNWQEAERAGDDSRALLFNLALAYQHQEQFWESAERWRTLLRRRPRKADHPDALTDQQVARIWQNIAENYSKAGEFEEAITTYKNALKWAPDSIDLRLKLVDAYQSEGRWQAAENELNRILEKEPDNIAALTLLGESYSDDFFQGRARQIWQRILKLEPQNPVARQQLAHTYEEDGSRWLYWQQDYEKAVEIFKEGLTQVPDSQRLLTVMGGTYADWGKFEQ